jgi:hypothetical protein
VCDGVDHILRGKSVALGDDGGTGRAASYSPQVGLHFHAGLATYRTVDTAAHLERCVCRVYDRIECEQGDVCFDGFETLFQCHCRVLLRRPRLDEVMGDGDGGGHGDVGEVLAGNQPFRIVAGKPAGVADFFAVGFEVAAFGFG